MHLQRAELANRDYADIYFSPHLDDVAFSCGGLIALQRSDGEQVLVVSVFTGGANPAEGGEDRILAPFLDMQQRREEDQKAMERLRVDHLWLGYLEAIQRNPRYGSVTRLTSHVLEGDAPLQEALWSNLVEICHPERKATLYFPLAVGNHVDHQILFKLGTWIEGQEGFAGHVWYYEEVPYTFIPGLLRLRMKLIDAAINPLPPDLRRQWNLGEIVRTYQGILGMRIIRANITPIQRPLLFLFLLHRVLMGVHLRARRQETERRHWISPEVIDVSEHLQAKLDAAGEYRSQIPTLFGDVEAFRRGMEGYSASVVGKGGRYVERYWRAIGRET